MSYLEDKLKRERDKARAGARVIHDAQNERIAEAEAQRDALAEALRKVQKFCEEGAASESEGIARTALGTLEVKP